MNARMYESVVLSEDEQALLDLPPNFAIYEAMTTHAYEVDIEECMAKLRYSRITDPIGTEDDSEFELTAAESDLFADIGVEARNVYDEGVLIYDVRKKNISDIKNNPRLTLPKPLSGHEEAIISCLKSDFMEIFKSYLADNCDEKGKIKAANLTKSQLRGLRSLLRRIANRDIMVVPTDKSGKLAAINWSVYCASMNRQIGADCLVGWSEVGPTQDNMNGHVSAWLKFTNTGQNWDQSQRIREGMIKHGQCVPPLYGLLKDHKPEGAWDPELGAPYRPVCGACLGPNASLSDLFFGNN